MKVLKLEKELNINGAILDKHQLEAHLRKTASSHILRQKSDKSTFPVPNIKTNFNFITRGL